jgi:signal transduction histidine kinase
MSTLTLLIPPRNQADSWHQVMAMPRARAMVRLLNWVTLVIGAACLLTALLGVNSGRLAMMIAGVGVIGWSLGSILLCRGDRYRLAVQVYVVAGMLVIALVRQLLPYQEDASRTVIAYVVFVIVSVMFLGPGAGRIVFVASTVLLYVDTYLRIPYTIAQNPDWVVIDLISYTFFYFITMLLCEFAMGTLVEQLTITRASQAELAAKNNALATEVDIRVVTQRDLAALVDGLQVIVNASRELMACESPEVLWRRAVELPREKLGIDRCAVYLYDGKSRFTGTFGTNHAGATVDERHFSFALTDYGLDFPTSGWRLLRDAERFDICGMQRKALSRGWVVQTPIFSMAGEPVGIMVNDGARTDAALDANRQELLAVYCSVLGGAIERLRMEQKIKHGAIMEERSRLARELHDSVSQALFGIVLGARTAIEQVKAGHLNVMMPLNYVLGLADGGLAEMRALIYELRPESLANEGLIPALQKQADALTTRHKLHVDTNFAGGEPELALDVKEALYRVAIEAIQNITKHAHATTVRLALQSDASEVTFVIADDGLGFDPSLPAEGHYGLTTMRERIERAGGRFAIESELGAGTQITMSVPLAHAQVLAGAPLG